MLDNIALFVVVCSKHVRARESKKATPSSTSLFNNISEVHLKGGTVVDTSLTISTL